MNASSDRVLPLTRWSALGIALLLFIAWALLTLWPDRTPETFAWAIRPNITALVMASGYGAGAFLLGRAFVAKRWREVSLIFPPLTLFVWLTALATVLHWDRFNHSHVMFWIWVAVYAVTPVLMPIVWLRNRSVEAGSADADETILPRPARAALAVAGAAELAVGVLMFALPQVIISLWPWSLTPLTARVISGWFAMAGLSAVLIGRQARWSASRALIQGGALLAALILIGIVRAWSDFDPANLLTWAYVMLIALTLAGFAGLYLVMESRRRQVTQNKK